MKRTKTMVVGLLVCWSVGEMVDAAQPPLDRPTPPPCCADGLCHPNPLVWGVYPTRWRRWPGEVTLPSPAEMRPEDRLAPDVGPFDAPSPEEEDQAAPRHTRPPAPAEPEAPPLEGAPSDGLEPPARLPWEDGGEETEPPGGLPWEDNLGEPTGDLDLPPAPPFAANQTSGRPAALQQPSRQTAVPSRREQPASRAKAGGDPPPAMPLALRHAAPY